MTEEKITRRQAIEESFYAPELIRIRDEVHSTLDIVQPMEPINRRVVSADMKRHLQSMARLYELYEQDGGFNKTPESRALFDVCFSNGPMGNGMNSAELEELALAWPGGIEIMDQMCLLIARIASTLNRSAVTQDRLAVESLGNIMDAALRDDHVQGSPMLTSMLEAFVGGLRSLDDSADPAETSPQVAKVFAFPARSKIGKDNNPPGTRLPAHHAQAKQMFDDWAADPKKYSNKTQFATAVIRERLCDDPKTAGKWLKDFMKELAPDSALATKLSKK